MRFLRAAGKAILLAVFLSACSAPGVQPAAGDSSAAQPQGSRPSDPDKSRPATVSVSQRYGDDWRPVTSLDAYADAGSAELQLKFSKPVKRQEVEQALVEGQNGFVRGSFQWDDDRTLNWLVSAMPSRLDFLLGSARDQDGTALPGGIPSLRLGGPPMLVTVDLKTVKDSPVAKLPPDLVSATLTSDRKAINLMAWIPGGTRWDWYTVDFHVDVGDPALKPGRSDAAQPRIPDDLESWVLSPQGNTVAGLRIDRRSGDDGSLRAELVIMDLRGGRRQGYAGFISRPATVSAGDVTTHLAWSGDGTRVGAVTRGAHGSDVVAVDIRTGQQAVLVRDLPVPPEATHLAWSADSRYLLAGNYLVDLQTGRRTVLDGTPTDARGAWEPGGTRLLYSVKDWGQLLVVDPATLVMQPAGTGLLVDWAGANQAYVVRWAASKSRYVPPGQ